MKYLPWDRLQLDPSLHNHSPVKKAEIVYPLYKSFRSSFAHIPYFHKNLAIYAADQKQREEVLQNLSKDNDPVQRFATVAVFDPSYMLSQVGNQLEQENTGFEYHEYQASFATLLQDLVTFRNEIRDKTRAVGFAESYHRRIYTIVLNLDDAMEHELRTVPHIQHLFQQLLTDVSSENMNIIMIAGNIFLPVRPFLDMFSQDAFLGEEHMDFALDFFAELDEGSISVMQEHIGWGRRIHSPRLTSLHPRKYTPSQWVQEREAAIAAEEDTYAKFLASLSTD